MLKKTNEFIYVGLLTGAIFFTFGSPAYAATYNTTNGELFLPTVFDGEKNYIDVTLRLDADGTYTFIERTEATLPFQCVNNFSDNTLDLINDQMSVSDVDSLLGCHWSASSTHASSSNGSEDINASFSWFDNQCTGIDLSFDLNGVLNFKSINYTNECKLIPNDAGTYNMTSNRFIIQNVIIDDILVAPVTILKFDVENETWALISVEIVDHGQPPYLCDQFTENTFTTKLQPFNSIGELESALGCQWSEKSGDTWTFRDHECSVVNISLSQNFSFKSLLYKKTGCGS